MLAYPLISPTFLPWSPGPEIPYISPLLQVWTSNPYCGVVGLFHLQGSSWDRVRRKFYVHDKAPEPLTGQVGVVWGKGGTDFIDHQWVLGRDGLH